MITSMPYASILSLISHVPFTFFQNKKKWGGRKQIVSDWQINVVHFEDQDHFFHDSDYC